MSQTPIAGRLITRMKRQTRGKLANIRDVVAGRVAAEQLQKTVVTEERLQEFHPAHAAYVYAQNQVSVMSEQLTVLDEMAPFVKIISEAEDLYMPSGPPMSPLTASYFTCWPSSTSAREPPKKPSAPQFWKWAQDSACTGTFCVLSD